jgi:hypothetical protein
MARLPGGFANMERWGSVSCCGDPGALLRADALAPNPDDHKGRPAKRPTPMALFSTIAEIIRNLLIFVAVMTALVVALVVWKMPDGNPLKRLLAALTYRTGATAAAGALAILKGRSAASTSYMTLPSPSCSSVTGSRSCAMPMSKASAPHGQRQIAPDGR